MKRIIPLLLLSVLLFSGLISCVTENEQSTQSIQKPENTSSEETVAETEEVFTLGLPKDMDLQGQTYIIWIYDDHLRGDIEGDEVAYSQYAARSSAEELLNYKSEFVIHNGGMVNDVRKVIQAQDDTYALCGESANGFAPLFAEKTFYNISDLPYINLNNPWWMSEYVRSVSIDENNPSLLTGDMSYYSIGMLCCSYVNDRLLNEYIGLSKDDMYQLVLDGKWTLDRFLTYSENAYHDINGNGEKDIDDIYALTAQGHYTFQKLLYGAGLMCTSRDEDGFPMLSLNNEYTINLIDKVLPLFNSDECYKTDENITAAQFAKGKNLFLVNRFVSAQWNLREMEDSYSIIPLPKYDENEKTYHSFIEHNGMVYQLLREIMIQFLLLWRHGIIMVIR